MMAKRFGGKYSPREAAREPVGPSLTGGRDERRTKWLLLVAVPFAIKAFWQDAAGLGLNLAAFAALLLAAWLTREGVRAANAYAARHSARRPAVPRKLMATVLTGGGLFLGALAPGAEIMVAVFLGLVGSILHFLAFGADPLRDKNMENVDRFQQDRVARIVVEGEAYLKSMKEAAERADDRQISDHVDRFLATARTMFRTVENDPRDLSAARRYLGVYLMGARDATIKFADIWLQNRNQTARSDYQALLTDLETNFAARTEMLLADDKSDLDIEIEVLRDRLGREGIKIENQ